MARPTGEAGADQGRDRGAGGARVAVHGRVLGHPAQHRRGHGHLPGQGH